MLRLHPSVIDYVILGIYFVVVLGIGFIARLAIKTDLDFFLSGRSQSARLQALHKACSWGAYATAEFYHTLGRRSGGVAGCCARAAARADAAHRRAHGLGRG